MSSADKHFCYPKYTQDEWDGVQEEIERHKELHIRAADALEHTGQHATIKYSSLVSELRKAAE